MLHRNIAVRVGGGTAQKGDVDREGFVKQVRLAVDIHQPNQVFAGTLVELAALDPRVDEGVHADPG